MSKHPIGFLQQESCIQADSPESKGKLPIKMSPGTAQKLKYYASKKPHKLQAIFNEALIEHLLGFYSPAQILDIAKRIDRFQDSQMALEATQLAEEF